MSGHIAHTGIKCDSCGLAVCRDVGILFYASFELGVRCQACMAGTAVPDDAQVIGNRPRRDPVLPPNRVTFRAEYERGLGAGHYERTTTYFEHGHRIEAYRFLEDMLGREDTYWVRLTECHTLWEAEAKAPEAHNEV